MRQDWMLIRYNGGPEATLGMLLLRGASGWRRMCFTLEDQFQPVKVPGETRIPAGTYRIKLRTEGGMHARYSKRFGSNHYGMLHLQDVPDFKWIYFHVGNDDDDTDGCILSGMDTLEDVGALKVLQSTVAYQMIVNHMVPVLEGSDGEVWLTIRDMDRVV